MTRATDEIKADLEQLDRYSDGHHGPVDPEWFALERHLLERELELAQVASPV
jgi:hypothetical protein